MLYIDLLRITRAPRMREAFWIFLFGIAFGLGGLFFAENSAVRETLLHWLIVFVAIAIAIAVPIVVSNTKLRRE